jgi:hypothetical protein
METVVELFALAETILADRIPADRIEINQALIAEDSRISQMRGLSDLFVTTSDSGYVGDLINNLAS